MKKLFEREPDLYQKQMIIMKTNYEVACMTLNYAILKRDF